MSETITHIDPNETGCQTSSPVSIAIDDESVIFECPAIRVERLNSIQSDIGYRALTICDGCSMNTVFTRPRLFSLPGNAALPG